MIRPGKTSIILHFAICTLHFSFTSPFAISTHKALKCMLSGNLTYAGYVFYKDLDSTSSGNTAAIITNRHFGVKYERNSD